MPTRKSLDVISLGAYRHLDWLIGANVLPFPIYQVSAGDLGAHEEEASMRDSARPILVPYRTRKSNGDVDLIRRQCTAHYKLAPTDRKLAELRAGAPVTLWLGISTDEAHRMKPARQKYKTHRYPLIEHRMTRGHCFEWLATHEYPRPPRSACIFCPLKGPSEWREMDGEEFERACRFDEHMRTRGGVDPLYVWRGATPLRDADFRTAADHGQGALWGEDCEGMCGV
jgi:hypothetical protein